MNIDNKYYSLITNAEHFADKRSLNISSLNGEVTIQAVVENYCQNFDPVLDLIEKHFEFFFERQFYNNPLWAVRDCLVYVGRQIHLAAKHNEVIYGAALSVVVTMLREQKLYVAKIGTLSLKQLQEDPSNNGFKLVDLFNVGAKDPEYLKMDNFHEILPVTSDIRTGKDERYIIANKQCFKNPDVLVNIQNVIKENRPIQFNELCTIIKFKHVTSYKHDDDSSFWKKISSIEYFKNIPTRHLSIIGILLTILIFAMIVFRPKDKIQPTERKLLHIVDSVIVHEDNLLKTKVDSFYEKVVDSSSVVIDTVRQITIEEKKQELRLSYTIKKKDNLYRLSKTFNVSIEKITAINSIKNNTIYPGQEIVLPYWKTHIVKKNETLYEIQQKYNVTVQQIMIYNNLDDIAIHDGMKLKIPYPNEMKL